MHDKYIGMTASELVKKLVRLIDEHGDLPVMHSLDGVYLELQEVYHHNDVADSKDGVFQLTHNHRERDDYDWDDEKFKWYDDVEDRY